MPPQEDARRIDRYGAARARAMTFGDESICHQGFPDCVCLLRWLVLL